MPIAWIDNSIHLSRVYIDSILVGRIAANTQWLDITRVMSSRASANMEIQGRARRPFLWRGLDRSSPAFGRPGCLRRPPVAQGRRDFGSSIFEAPSRERLLDNTFN